MQMLKQIQTALFDKDVPSEAKTDGLKTPKEARKEVEALRD